MPLKVISIGLLDNKSAFILEMAWCWRGSQPSLKPVLIPHNSGVTWPSWHSKSLAIQLYFQQFLQTDNGDLSVRLESRIGPQRHRVVVKVHWRGAQGWRSLAWLVATFNRVGGSFNLLMSRHWGCLNKPIFSNLGLWVACWAYFMCHPELWPTSVSHPFSFLNSS